MTSEEQPFKRYNDPDEETLKKAHQKVHEYDRDELIDLLSETFYPDSFDESVLNGANIVSLADDVRKAERMRDSDE